MSQFCSICTSTRGPFTTQQLDGHGVTVCAACDEPAFEKRGPERGYEPTGGLLTRDVVTQAAKKLLGEERYARIMAEEDELGRTPARPMDEGDRIWRDHVYEGFRRQMTNAHRDSMTAAEKVKGQRR